MDEEIERMRDELLALKRRRNARLAIARIPPELLSEIFLFFRDASIHPTSDHWTTLPWISITHVAAHWRSVALADPRMWNLANLRFPDLVRHYSTRIGSMPLRVVLSGRKPIFYGTHEADYALDAIRALHNPIRSLEITASARETAFILENLIAYAADHLVHLAIDLHSTVSEQQILERTPLPALQSLSLGYVSFEVSSPFLASCTNSLRELKLNNCTGWEWDAKNLESFTCLEKLSLMDSVNFGRFPHATQIKLPTLTELYLQEGLDTILRSVRAFTCAPGCIISACIFTSEIDIDWLLRLEPVIICMSSAHPDHTRVHICKDFVELQYDGENTHYTLKIVCATRGPSAVLPAILPHYTTKLSIICDKSAALPPSDMHALLEGLGHLQSLIVCGRPFVVSLHRCLSENPEFHPNLGLLQLCHCCADLEGRLSQAVSREYFPGDIRVGGVESCTKYRQLE